MSRPASSRRFEDVHVADALFAALVLMLLGLVASSFRDYGVLWDDQDHLRNGNLFLEFYRDWSRHVLGGEFDFESYEPGLLHVRAALFDGTGSLLNLVSPFGEFETRRLLGGLVGIIGIAGCWALTRELAGPLAALFAALCLSLYPVYYGHAFMNPKDIPFAAGYVWSIHYLVRSIRRYPNVPVSLSIHLGLAIGLTLAIRIGGLLLLCYVALAMGLYLAQRLARERSPAALAPDALALARSGLVTLAVAYPLMLLWWPWAQLSPLRHPVLAFQTAADHPWYGEILLAGTYVHSAKLPASYLPHYFLVKTPELLLFGAALALLLGLRGLARRPFREDPRGGLAWGILVFALLFPPVYAIVQRTILYDTLRHFLFLTPLVASIAGMGYGAGFDWLREQPRVFRYAIPVMLALVLARHIQVMWILHPHQYIYYNQLAGGVAGADGRYETDYWGNSYAEAVRALSERLRWENPRAFARTRYAVHVCGGWQRGTPSSAVYFFPPNFVYTRDLTKADFVLCLTRWRQDREIEGSVYLEVERFGVPLTVVKDRRAL